jgi:hypothetical protein
VRLAQIFHRVLARATEPQVLFTLVGAFLLAVIWATTLEVARVKHSDAQRVRRRCPAAQFWVLTKHRSCVPYARLIKP